MTYARRLGERRYGNRSTISLASARSTILHQPAAALEAHDAPLRLRCAHDAQGDRRFVWPDRNRLAARSAQHARPRSVYITCARSTRTRSKSACGAHWSRVAPEWPQLFAGYGCCVDWPSAYYWRELIDFYPDAKVVLTSGFSGQLVEELEQDDPGGHSSEHRCRVARPRPDPRQGVRWPAARPRACDRAVRRRTSTP